MIGYPHQNKENPLTCTCIEDETSVWYGFNERKMRFLLTKFGRPQDILPHIKLDIAPSLEENATGRWTILAQDNFENREGCCSVKPIGRWRSVTRITSMFDLEWTSVALHQTEDWMNLHLMIHLHEKPGIMSYSNHLDLSLVQLNRLLKEMNVIYRFSGALKLFEPCCQTPVWNRTLLSDDNRPHNKGHPHDLRLCLYRVCKIHTNHLDDYLLHIEHWEYAYLERRVIIRMREEEYLKLEDLSLLLTQLYGSGGGFVVERSVLLSQMPECLGLLGAYRVNPEELPVLPHGKKRFMKNHFYYVNNSLLCYNLKPEYNRYEETRAHQRFVDEVDQKMFAMKKRVVARRALEDAQVLTQLPNWDEDSISVEDEECMKYLAELPNWCEET